MSIQETSFDAGVFVRTASLFAVKREAFGPDAVAALASDIVRRLATTMGQMPRIKETTVSPAQVRAFCDVLILTDPIPAIRFIEARRSEGVTRHDVYLGYICAAARQLGDGWEEDRLSLVEVAIGTGHLYAMMRAMRAEGPATRPIIDNRRRALFATVPGEDHGIGITVAADLFRDLGWEIDLQTATEHDDLIAQIEATRPEIIGLSLSTEARLDALVRVVVAIRLAMPHAIIGVARGATLDAQKVSSIVDIDLLFEDARSALIELDRLIRLRN